MRPVGGGRARHRYAELPGPVRNGAVPPSLLVSALVHRHAE